MNLLHVLALSSVLAGTPDDTVDVFQDKGDLFVRAGTNKGLKMGSEVKLLGDKIGDSNERRVVGKANVIEVYDTIARVMPDDEAKKAKPVAAKVALADAPKPKEAGCSDAKPNAPQVSQHWGMLNDHFIGKCCGTQVEVVTHGTTMGASLKLIVDGNTAEEQEPFSGNTVTLHGTAGNGAKVAVEIVVGSYGGDYRLKVAGQTCELVHQ